MTTPATPPIGDTNTPRVYMPRLGGAPNIDPGKGDFTSPAGAPRVDPASPFANPRKEKP